MTKKQRRAMIDFKTVTRAGCRWGRRRMAQMQGLQRIGLVESIAVNGEIADWRLTAAGEAWEPPT